MPNLRLVQGRAVVGAMEHPLHAFDGDVKLRAVGDDLRAHVVEQRLHVPPDL